ncbi:hypothetical protein KPH14_009336 [Odynerus spinipes]|uniref:Uncharacterized protein n=1 Tax=Odynerus spinipes TaxID=1348599 RepID=A0AAD9RP31_9HYME|nr:hypothetical protein KPH14_009336 [Odynerus spinipes]
MLTLIENSITVDHDKNDITEGQEPTGEKKKYFSLLVRKLQQFSSDVSVAIRNGVARLFLSEGLKDGDPSDTDDDSDIAISDIEIPGPGTRP